MFGSYKELLFQELVLQVAWCILKELAIGNLNRFLRAALVTCGVQGLDSHYDGIVVLFQVDQVVSAVLRGVDLAHLLRKLLLESRGELISVWVRQTRVSVEAIERYTRPAYYKGMLEAFLHS